MMRVCEARNMGLQQVMGMTEEEILLILAHAGVENDLRKAEEKKSSSRRR